MYKFLIILAVAPLIMARTPVRQCDGGYPMPTAVHFNGRENPCLAEPCDVVRSSGYATTTVDFTPGFDSVSIRPRVRATVFGGLTITQILPQEIIDTPCIILDAPHTCPLAANEPISYTLTLPVDSTTPLIPADNEITLFGDNDQVIFCYKLRTEIVA